MCSRVSTPSTWTVSSAWYVLQDFNFLSLLITDDLQAKEYLSAVSLRKIIALQNELVKSTPGVDRPNISSPISAANANAISRAPTQRTLLSSTFTAPVANGARAANSLGRNILSAGDKLRDLIVPESLASVVSAGVWSTGLDRIGLDRMWGSAVGDRGEKSEFGRRV